ncbi:fructosamine kinase family protein [Staphylococcus aureus]
MVTENSISVLQRYLVVLRANFIDAYNKHYPLAKGASYRLEFYRLYLLMVHLLKFGEMYRDSVAHSMDKILQE